MSTSSATRLMLMAPLIAIGLIALPAPSPAHAGRACGTVAIDYEPLPGERYTGMRVIAPRSLACHRALTVMRRHQRDKRGCDPLGGNTCAKRFRGGWTCLSPTAIHFPRIAECSRTRRGRYQAVIGRAIR